jgi:hypothetical protein
VEKIGATGAGATSSVQTTCWSGWTPLPPPRRVAQPRTTPFEKRWPLPEPLPFHRFSPPREDCSPKHPLVTPLDILSAAGCRSVAATMKLKPLPPLHPQHGEPSLRPSLSTIVGPSSLPVASSSCRTSPPLSPVIGAACRHCRIRAPSRHPAASVRTPPPHLSRCYPCAPLVP